MRFLVILSLSSPFYNMPLNSDHILYGKTVRLIAGSFKFLVFKNSAARV
jgi:hypothetical protein